MDNIKNCQLIKHDINLLILKGLIDNKDSILIIKYDINNELMNNCKNKNKYKYSIISPINENLLVNLNSKLILVKESSSLYWNEIDKYINKLIINGNINWMNKILNNKNNKNIIYQDSKFLLLRDIIWDGKNINNLYVLGIPKNSKIRSIRDLTASDIPLLKYMYNKIAFILHKKWNIKKNEMYYFFHYHPSFYYLHLHICRINHHSLQSKFLRPQLLNIIIDNLETNSNYYHNCNMYYEIPKNHNIYKYFFKN